MKVSIIGCGNLGSAITLGLLRGTSHLEVTVCDRNEKKLRDLVSKAPRPVKVTLLPAEALTAAQVVLLLVKPKDVLKSLQELKRFLSPESILVSCAVGIELKALEKHFSSDYPVARAMPNMAVRFSKGTTALLLNKACEQAAAEDKLQTIFGSLGDVQLLKNEEQFHAVAALSGSSPAFLLLAMEALVEAGIKGGLSLEEAHLFAKGGLKAAAALVEEGEAPFEVLRHQVTSPAGTTIAGIESLEKNRNRFAIMSAVSSSIKRSKEIAAYYEGRDSCIF